MATKQQVVEELNYLSNAVSDRFRAVSTGVLAFCWAFIVADKVEARILSLHEVTIPVMLALASILCDALQYVFGYVSTKRTFENLEQNERAGRNDEVYFDRSSLLYRLRTWLWAAKSFLSFLAAFFLILALGYRLYVI